MPLHRRLRSYLLLLLLGATVQCYWLDRKVPWVSPEEYSADCRDLLRTQSWVFGYWEGHHGALLVRTAASARGQATPGQSELESIMRAELASVLPKAALELALYFFVAAGLVAFWAGGQPRLRRSAALMGGASLVLSGPLLFLSYGGSLYTNLVGPGAYSYSGPYFAVHGIAADTVSYRPAMEALGLAPLTVQDAVGLWAVIPDVGFIAQWTIGVVGFYGAVGALLAWVLGRWSRAVAGRRRGRPEAAAEQ